MSKNIRVTVFLSQQARQRLIRLKAEQAIATGEETTLSAVVEQLILNAEGEPRQTYEATEVNGRREKKVAAAASPRELTQDKPKKPHMKVPLADFVLNKNGHFSSKEVAEAAGITMRSAQRNLKNLVAAGKIKQIKKGQYAVLSKKD